MNKNDIVQHLEKIGLVIESSEVDTEQYRLYCFDKEHPSNRFFITIKEK